MQKPNLLHLYYINPNLHKILTGRYKYPRTPFVSADTRHKTCPRTPFVGISPRTQSVSADESILNMLRTTGIACVVAAQLAIEKPYTVPTQICVIQKKSYRHLCGTKELPYKFVWYNWNPIPIVWYKRNPIHISVVKLESLTKPQKKRSISGNPQQNVNN